MSEFRGTFSDFKRYMGIFFRHKSKVIIKKRVSKDKVCDGCNKNMELHVINLKVESEIDVLKKIIDDKYRIGNNDQYVIDLNELESIFTDAVLSDRNHYLLLCQNCREFFSTHVTNIPSSNIKETLSSQKNPHIIIDSSNNLSEVPDEYQEFHIRDCESIQKYVKRLMPTLYERGFLTEEELLKLQDLDYCRKTFRLNHPLLERDYWKIQVKGHNRYWVKKMIDQRFYVCSQWWKDHFLEYEKLIHEWVNRLIIEKKYKNL